MKEEILDKNNNLDLLHYKDFLDISQQQELLEILKYQIPWYRVCYLSERHENHCVTPCYTNFFGGFSDLKPYQPIPSCLDEIIRLVSEATGGMVFNAILIRLYIDGSDNIAWHTDGRTFLGDEPTIASLSLGASCKFQLRKMTNVWPCTGTTDGGIDKKVPMRELILKGGDLVVMRGKTQQSWHHRVPKQPGRGVRVNINFRYILPDRSELSLRGVRAFYRYMVCGDSKTADWEMTAQSHRFEDIMRRHYPLHHQCKVEGAHLPLNDTGNGLNRSSSISKRSGSGSGSGNRSNNGTNDRNNCSSSTSSNDANSRSGSHTATSICGSQIHCGLSANSTKEDERGVPSTTTMSTTTLTVTAVSATNDANMACITTCPSVRPRPRPIDDLLESAVAQDNGWACATCTYINVNDTSASALVATSPSTWVCAMCNEPYPKRPATPASGTAKQPASILRYFSLAPR